MIAWPLKNLGCLACLAMFGPAVADSPPPGRSMPFTIDRAASPPARVWEYRETVFEAGRDAAADSSAAHQTRWQFTSDGHRWCFATDRGLVAALWDGNTTWTFQRSERAVTIHARPVSPHPEALAELLLACEGLDALHTADTLQQELHAARSFVLAARNGPWRRFRYELLEDAPGWSHEVAGTGDDTIVVDEQSHWIPQSTERSEEGPWRVVRIRVLDVMHLEGRGLPRVVERTTHDAQSQESVGLATSTIRYEVDSVRAFMPEHDAAALVPPPVEAGWRVDVPRIQLRFEVGSHDFRLAGQSLRAPEPMTLESIGRLDEILSRSVCNGSEPAAPAQRS